MELLVNQFIKAFCIRSLRPPFMWVEIFLIMIIPTAKKSLIYTHCNIRGGLLHTHAERNGQTKKKKRDDP